jgi:hypothetical protein
MRQLLPRQGKAYRRLVAGFSETQPKMDVVVASGWLVNGRGVRRSDGADQEIPGEVLIEAGHGA